MLNQIQFKLFKNYQKEFAHRLFILREEERLVPVVDGNDVNVPRVKIVHKGPPNKALPANFFADELSCIFTSEMIQKYGQLHHEFAQQMRKKSWPRDLADLILLDIQFLSPLSRGGPAPSRRGHQLLGRPVKGGLAQ